MSWSRIISIPDMELIILNHEEWLRSNKQAGNQADFTDVYLEGRVLSKRDLREAIFTNSNLRAANLSCTNFRGANFSGASLQNADISGADFSESGRQATDLSFINFAGSNLNNAQLHGAKLQYADLTGGRNFIPRQLGGTDLSGANLPVSFLKAKPLMTVDEACRNGRRLFLAITFICVFILFNIINTTDARLLANLPASKLPFIGIELPSAIFYLVSPLLLIFLYMYVHIHMQRYLWEEISFLPAVFPTGKPLDKMIYPWLITGLVRFYFNHLRHRLPLLTVIQVIISSLFAWLLVPIVLILLWLKYLPRHDWQITFIQSLVAALAISSGCYFFILACKTLRGEIRRHFNWRDLFLVWRHALVFIITIFSFYFISFCAFNGTPNSIIPRILQSLTFSAFPNFEEVDVSTRPIGWLGETRKELSLVKGANLRRRDLRYLKGFKAFLVNADLSYTDLRGADLQFADIRGANLYMAKIGGANLQGADLRWANLRKIVIDKETVLQDVNFYEACFYNPGMCTILNDVNMANCNLQKTNFRCTWLQRANFTNANLEDANLQQVNLVDAKLIKARLNKADLDNADLRNTQLLGADLSEADLEEANMERAKLNGANLINANLKNANLNRADLRGVKGFTRKQLNEAVINNTLLPLNVNKLKQFDNN